MTVKSNLAVEAELYNYFSFEVKGAQFMKRNPKYRYWDGMMRLYNKKEKTLYCGLYEELEDWVESRGHWITIEDNVWYGNTKDKTSKEEFKKYVPVLKNDLGDNFTVRRYQWDGIYQAIVNNRNVFLSPTGSGKSLIIYGITKYHFLKKRKILIIVPTTSLVEQMSKDFESYGCDESHIHKIYAGMTKETNKYITISTWQSIYELKQSYFERFDCIIGDEAHQFKAKSLISIMSKAINAKYRYGFTGSLDGEQVNKLTLEGVFGSVRRLVKSKELMENKHLADLEIKTITLNHHYLDVFNDYQEEIDYLLSHKKRNNFIIKLANKIDGNTIVFFNYVEKHGEILYDLLQEKSTKPVFLVHGKVPVQEREDIRCEAEKLDSSIIVASYGVFSTGINIRKIHNVIFAMPTKSRVRTIQSIGRSLRISVNKDKATIYDLADNINGENYTLEHSKHRKKFYDEEEYNFKNLVVDL